mmetsp:Transcript_25365/g.22490  ORF Transcript_25365/g.22490 Transcript_25365/m.22490 type:complete len:252 (+) Transcript_25365:2615-3370(+)
MISFRIVNNVKTFIREYGRMVGGGKKESGSRTDNIKQTLKSFEKTIPDFLTATENHYKGYQLLIENFKPIYSNLINTLLTVGQLQLVRRIVLSHLNFVAKIETPFFYSCLSNLNDATFNSMEFLKNHAKDIKEEAIEELSEEYDSDDSQYDEKKRKDEERKKHGEQHFHLDDQNDTKGEKILKKLLKDLGIVLETSGFLEPIHKVFVLAKDIDYMALCMLLFTLTAAKDLHYDLNVNSLVRKNKNCAIDGP